MTFFSIVASLVVVVLLLQIDDEIDPALNDILQSETTNNSNAYFYQLGFMASPEDDPITVGKRSFAKIQTQQLANKKRQASDRTIEFTPINALPEIKSDLLCSYSEINCLTTIFNNAQTIPALLEKHQIYIDRFEAFTHYQDFHTLTEASLIEPMVSYLPVVNAVRLIFLEQVYSASHGQVTQSIETLLQTHHQLRNLLQQHDTIIGKLIYLSLISDNIDLIYLISTRNEFQLTEKYRILPLNKQEKSLTSGFHREIQMMTRLYQSLDKAPDIFNQADQHGDFQSPPWLTRALFKPHMSSNQSYKITHYYAQLSELNLDEFSEQVLTAQNFPIVQPHWVRNWIGTVLTQIAGPDFTSYIARFWSLNNKIHLFNANIGKPIDAHHFDQVFNLYPSLKNEKASLTKDGKQVCLNSPFDDAVQTHCLQLKVH